MRKNLLSDLVGEKAELTAVNLEAPAAPARAAPLGSKGAVGAMSKALAQITSDREASARPAADIVEIDTDLIVESSFRDRLEEAGGDRDALVASIREAGQQVPILVRPHASEIGRYQIAYGHRRVAALRELGRPVRAFVRSLTDAELIVAQGAENNARKDLSFIERAHFAATLEKRGVDRTTIMAALSVDKTELSRLISVTRSIPLDLIERIGPAPKAGRRRWMNLAERIEPSAAAEEARRVTASDRFKALPDSDSRFLAIFTAVAPSRGSRLKPEVWKDEAGRKLARVERADGRFTLSIDETLEPSFGDYLLEQLPEILASFRRRDGA
jgi:ParB family chromosome partitioning protein